MSRIAVAGMQLALDARGGNLARVRERLAYTMHLFPWVDMVVLSELAICGPNPATAEPLPGPTEEELADTARHHQIWLVTGSLFEKRGGKIYNTASVISPSGEVVGRYRKMFPFLPYEVGVEPGSEFLVFDVPQVGRFGVSICYDMWFPETSRALAAMGAEVILHPSMTTTIDRNVELAMAQATAAQQQCYFIDVNGAGEVGNGRSIIVGPHGIVLYQAGNGDEIIPMEIDLSRVRQSRESGLLGLGQPLKSFRDSTVAFPVYHKLEPRAYLESLGPLKRRTRTSPPAGSGRRGGASKKGT